MVIQVGLTGGIGSGKSTVALTLVAIGAGVIDADDLSRKSTSVGGQAIEAIRRQFGSRAIDSNGAMNRAFMRGHIFADPIAKLQLEAIVHPIVADGIRRAQALAKSVGTKVLVLDIPLLVESPLWRSQLDYVIVVDCSQDTQIARVSARSGWAQEQVQAVIKVQASRKQRLAAADIVVHNQDISLTQLATEVREIGHEFGL